MGISSFRMCRRRLRGHARIFPHALSLRRSDSNLLRPRATRSWQNAEGARIGGGFAGRYSAFDGTETPCTQSINCKFPLPASLVEIGRRYRDVSFAVAGIFIIYGIRAIAGTGRAVTWIPRPLDRRRGPVAQWGQSQRLITAWLEVKVLPGPPINEIKWLNRYFSDISGIN